MALSLYFLVRSLLSPDTGLLRYDPEIVVHDGAVFFFPSSPFSAPLAAGVQPESDRILSVGSAVVTGSRDLVCAALAIRDFIPFPVRVLRGDGSSVTILVKPYFRPMRPDWIFELVFCLMLGAAGFTLVRKLPREVSTLPLALSVLLSLLFVCIMPFSCESLAANVVANAGNISSWLLVIFAMYFPWKRGSRGGRLLVVALITAMYAAFCAVRAVLFLQWMSTGSETAFGAYRDLGRLVIVSDGIAYGTLALLLGSAYARSRLPRDRRMLQWMLVGVLIAFPPYFFLDQLPLILGGSVHHVGLGSLAQLFLSVLPLCLLLALVRSTALNLRSFLARYAIGATLLALTVGAFGIAWMPLSSYLGRAYRVTSPLPEVLAAAVVVLGLFVLRGPIERLFRPLRRAPLGGLPDLITWTEGNAASAQRLAETRAVITGIVRTLRGPVRILASSAAERGGVEQQEAAAETTFFLGTLESLAGGPPSMDTRAEAWDLMESAVARVRARFPGVAFGIGTGGSARILCHAEEVIQALGFLLENAAEAGPGDAGRVDVRCVAVEGRALVEIADSGPGLDIGARRRLFRPFWTTKPGHRGLGLYFARMIIERNEGGIVFDRTASGGTLVRVAFPLLVEGT